VEVSTEVAVLDSSLITEEIRKRLHIRLHGAA
jgi:hypothetical protein